MPYCRLLLRMNLILRTRCRLLGTHIMAIPATYSTVQATAGVYTATATRRAESSSCRAARLLTQ